MASTILRKDYSGAGNKQRQTISVWVKRCGGLGINQAIFSVRHTGNANFYGYLRFKTDNSLHFYNNSPSVEMRTNRLFKDTNAWYHICVTIDTTQSTEADRIKIYINGVQETSFQTATYPSQNAEVTFGDDYRHEIGSYDPATIGTAYFDGVMSHFHFITNTAYQASTFGSTDSVTGEWQINTSPTVTYATNSFFLLKDGNSVTDQSGQGNNYTVAGGTLTKTEDNPSNVFNVFSDTTSKKAYTSEAGLKVSETASSWNLGVGGTIGASSGKYYWEFYKTANSDNFIAGIIPSAEFHRLAESTAAAVYNATNAIQLGASTSWWYKIGTGDSTTISGYGHGSGSKSSGLFQFALDLTNKKMWIGKDGTWYNSGNPATGANPLWTGSAVFPDDIYVPYWQGYGTVSGRFNFGGGSFGSDAVASAGTNASGNGVFELDVPTGFTALSTKGLNT